MLNQLLSGNIQLPGPTQVTLAPLAAVARILVRIGFPAGSYPRTFTATPSPELDRATSRAHGSPKAEPVPDEPAIPAFAYLFHEEDLIVPATSKLTLFLPQSEVRAHPVRVVEQSAYKAKWYSIETWHENVRRWIARDTAPKKDAAVGKAHEMPWLACVESEECND
ncbi:hypothetical protein [Paraburkholderia humisilvae]|uniref:Uncharacterized protein n=1 Tax=Paraburkholderia humisilvae TaxID=627669 RepID=A0A6J5DLJ6_9BURK|nr:hypothetical protein [Paraburkholderia humisilvae]CAB3754344.1 hypothetical protein LMG29542_02322 [Paraburkholderia humisilvae]